ncbi:MAG: hypothetical protein IJU03_06495 [Thermoguttaceae bacterium]|nr:hypothetical protein [Thermoguttaceae bacterium]
MTNALLGNKIARRIRLAALFVVASACSWSCLLAADAFRWSLDKTTLVLTEDARAYLIDADGEPIAPPTSAFKLGYPDGSSSSGVKVEISDEKSNAFDVVYKDGARASYEVQITSGAAVFQLNKLTAPSEPEECFLFTIDAPDGDVAPWINTETLESGLRVGVMTTSINAIPIILHQRSDQGDRDGCSHSFNWLARGDADDSGSLDATCVAEFRASSTRPGGDGWSFCGRPFEKALDLSKCVKLRARVYGDGKGEALKVQLGGKSGRRDDYIEIDFKGWKVCELTNPPLNDLTYDDVRNLYFYYNSLPGKTDVRCLIDWVEAVLVDENGKESVLTLEDFSDDKSPYWYRGQTFTAKTYARHKLFPASCAVIATPEQEWAKTIQQVQALAGTPSPRPGGGWRGESPYLHENYLFLTWFNADEYDAALDMAKRGGFKQILLLQNSWTTSTGHYRVNEKNFPGGVDTLRDVVERFRSEGIRFGLHFLGASVDSNDPYMTPVPDKRFVTDYSAPLEEALAGDAESKTIKVAGDATKFPTGEDPYMGSGQLVRIDDEIIAYGRAEGDGLYECERGYYGTTITEHAKGAEVKHFTRAYGYHLPDLDTDFIDEIAGNFAELANQLPIDMIYFDGSELLQRPGEGYDHWYYNARLHKAFYDKLDNKNILFQGSSCSPYSWHMIARNASADGHDDLKAYLEERSGGFSRKHSAESYLDVGWYYAYDKNATPDMYEYCLGATIAYDASFSFQTSVSAASSHPFIGEILDMIKEYQALRLSGKIPAELCAKFEIDRRLAGRKSVDERNALLNLRNEFHLEKDEQGRSFFRRVRYPVWQNVCGSTEALGGTTSSDASEENGAYVWDFVVDQPGALGFQIHYIGTADADPEKKLVNPKITILRVEDGKETPVGSLQATCELTPGQFAFVTPGKSTKVYGQPLKEPVEIKESPASIRLAPGTYKARFELESDVKIPARARLPLYTDETFYIGE